uniref:Uncharacterized protein n=1 Tax=Parasteatoda tepidariorum TaxID=114398 RepID=A0A2L2YP04_PARTP
MFKVDDCFKSCGIFNEILVKRFEENFNPKNNSRLWITPGHIVFTTEDTKVHTCDARPYDFSTSPSEAETDELLVTTSPVLDLFFDTEGKSTRMFLILKNGDVQIFEYRILLFEWARIGYFNVNITSPNSNNNHHNLVTHVLISYNQNFIYWTEKTGPSDTCFSFHKREIPLNGVREITQSAIGVPQKLFKNCPEFDVVEIRDNLCLVPRLPNSINIYIIISARSHVWLFHMDGKLLWRGIITDSPMDFISLCTKAVGLWKPTGVVKVCKLLDPVKNFAYMLHNESLISIAPNGEIRHNVSLNISPNNIEKAFIMQNALCIFTEECKQLKIYNCTKGEFLQAFQLNEFSPVTGIWYHSSSIPSLGFYCDSTIYKLNYKSLNSLLISDVPCLWHILNLLKNEHFHVFSIIRDIVYHSFESSDIPPLKNVPRVLQSEALILALLQSCRDKGFKSDNFPIKNVNEFLVSNSAVLPETKLRELLDPLVECFKKLEKCRIEQYQLHVQ